LIDVYNLKQSFSIPDSNLSKYAFFVINAHIILFFLMYIIFSLSGFLKKILFFDYTSKEYVTQTSSTELNV